MKLHSSDRRHHLVSELLAHVGRLLALGLGADLLHLALVLQQQLVALQLTHLLLVARLQRLALRREAANSERTVDVDTYSMSFFTYISC